MANKASVRGERVAGRWVGRRVRDVVFHVCVNGYCRLFRNFDTLENVT